MVWPWTFNEKIEGVKVENPRFMDEWGINAYDYQVYDLKGEVHQVDFQDLMVVVTEKRAVSVEKEVKPLSTRVRTRNAKQKELGDLLAQMSNIQAQYKSDDGGDEKKSVSDTTQNLLTKYGIKHFTGSEIKKSECEQTVQEIKTLIDKCNNDGQSDITRLQGLVERRDESYSTATTMMSKISDTRDNLIKNLF